MKKLFTLSAVLLSAAALSAQTFVSTATTNKNVVLEEYTGIRCVHCPDGHRIAEQIKTNNPGRFFPINIHTGSFAINTGGQPDYTTTSGDAIASIMGISGYPTGSINRIYYDSTYVIGRGYWSNKTTQQKNITAIVNVAARCTLNLDNRELKTHVEIYYTGNGMGTEDKLNVAILQNKIEGPQTGSGYNPSQVLPNGNYQHNHMLRTTLTGDFGESISPITAGSFIEKSYTHTVPAKYGNIPAELHNLEVIAYIADSLYIIQNANQATMTYLTTTPHKITMIGASAASTSAYCSTVGSAKASFLNLGNEAVTELAGYYTVNGGTQIPFTKSINNIALGNSGDFTIDNIDLVSNSNTVVITVNSINGNAVTPLSSTAVLSQAEEITNASNEAEISITYDSYSDENSWTFKNLTTNTTLHSQPASSSNRSTTITKTFTLVDGNCYEFIVNDSYGDGMCCAYGNGAISFKLGGQELVASNVPSTMGDKYARTFTYKTLVGVQENHIANNVNLYPNPTNGLINISLELAEAQTLKVEVINTLGQVVNAAQNFAAMEGQNQLQLQVNNLASGMYFVRLSNTKGQQVLPFTLNK